VECVVTQGATEQGSGVGGMSTRTAAWLAWAVCALSMILTVLRLLLLALHLSHPDVPIYRFWAEDVLMRWVSLLWGQS
jgi:hypothetical protein